MIFKKYQKDLEYAYVFGAFGTIELLKHKPEKCISVLIDPSFVKNESFNIIKELCRQYQIDIVIDKKSVDKIRDKGNIYVIGVFKKYQIELTNKKHIVLYNIQDVGMIGTMIRSLRGFYFENLVLIHCDIDLFDEHLIRSTMGAFFSTNIQQFEKIEDYIQKYAIQNLFLISKSGEDLVKMNKKEEYSLIFSKIDFEYKDLKKIKMDKDIALDHLLNIVLFYFNKK